MNIKLYNHYGAPDIWLDYSVIQGEFYITRIYSGSDNMQVDFTDFLSDSVLAHAEKVMRQDWIESAAYRAEYIYAER